MSKEKILIIGSSGTVGSEIAKILDNLGFDLLLATSKEPKLKNQVRINLATGEGVHNAFEGVDKAFLISPPGYADQYTVLSPLIQESKRRGLKKIVLMTAMGANAVETAPFRRAEIELEKSGLKYNIIRPNWFFQNFNSFWLNDIVTKDKILLPAGNAKVSFIDARDIAAVAAKLLTTSNFDNRDFDITGPEAIDHNDVAQAISETSGRKVIYQETDPEILKNKLLQVGLPKEYVEFLLMILQFLKAGYSAAVTDNVKQITGSKPRDLKQYANDHKQFWK